MRITTFPALVRHAIRAALFLAAGTGPAAVAAVMMAAARASIQAADARRHVSALADDTLEGREGGSRGGRAAGSYIVSHLEKLGLEPAGDNGSWYQQFGGMRNILAIARGSDPAVANELIVVGAHYDHVGYGNSGNSYGPFGFVHNGADDNASGVAGLIEMAEAMQHLPARPRRPILFAFWDGEEKGLLGSYHFVRGCDRPSSPRCRSSSR
ncbi:MAG: M20/M25/M40 family metallo-hydrolase [Planctomycetia bacterium]